MKYFKECFFFFNVGCCVDISDDVGKLWLDRQTQQNFVRKENDVVNPPPKRDRRRHLTQKTMSQTLTRG